MSPTRHRPATPNDNFERLVRLDEKIEQFVERQEVQHAENKEAMAVAAAETREHRHRTANALVDLGGRLGEISAIQKRQAEQIAGLVDLSKTAAAERAALGSRLAAIEMIKTLAVGQWRIVAFVFGGLAALAGAVAAVEKAVGIVAGWFKV